MPNTAAGADTAKKAHKRQHAGHETAENKSSFGYCKQLLWCSKGIFHCIHGAGWFSGAIIHYVACPCLATAICHVIWYFSTAVICWYYDAYRLPTTAKCHSWHAACYFSADVTYRVIPSTIFQQSPATGTTLPDTYELSSQTCVYLYQNVSGAHCNGPRTGSYLSHLHGQYPDYATYILKAETLNNKLSMLTGKCIDLCTRYEDLLTRKADRGPLHRSYTEYHLRS